MPNGGEDIGCVTVGRMPPKDRTSRMNYKCLLEGDQETQMCYQNNKLLVGIQVCISKI